METCAPYLNRGLVDRGERPFRGIGWGLVLSLPAWLGIALLFLR